MSQYLLAHDLGTSGNKATLFSADGQYIKSSVVSYPVYYSNGVWAEQDPNEWWKAVCDSTKEILRDVKPADIAAVSFSGQMMGVVPVGRDGDALRNSIIWADMRAIPQETALDRVIGMRTIYRTTGHRLSASYSLAKLMWIRDNQPEIFNKIYKTLCAKDYIIAKLTGRFVTDPSDASGTNAFDLNTFQWSEDILKAAGISIDMFPDVLASTDVAGTVTAEGARRSGLLEGTPVVVGGGDGLCASVGAGSIAPGITYNCLGSSSWICTVTEKPIFDENMVLFNWAHMVPGYVAPCGTMQAAGASFSWAMDKFQTGAASGASKYEAVNRLIGESAPGANGLVFLPYLMGERSPRWNPDARGAMIGLKMDTTSGDMLRAVVEGVAMNLNVILRAMSDRLDIKEMIVIGGLAQSEIIRNILGDVYGLPIAKLNFLEEGTSLGAAVAAGIGVGALDGFEDIHKFMKVECRERYNAENHAKYEEIQKIFDGAYTSLLGVFKDIVKLDSSDQ